jgi:hypothetical protein
MTNKLMLMKSILCILFGLSLIIFIPGYSQQVVTGKVMDEKGRPLGGVNVMEKGTVNGTVTDAEGIFSLKIDSRRNTITVSYIGIAPEEFLVSGRSTLNIVLKTKPEDLKYWCCTDHPAPTGPHCGSDKEVLKKTFGCKNFERE